MEMIRYAIFSLYILAVSSLYAQTPRETRAVWIATNHRLDWPPATLNEDEQKNELKNILKKIEQKNLNTVYFQVRSNGTTMYKSSFEPFSPYITKNANATPAYDPLEFATIEAHKHGLEIHAWINTFRILNGNISDINNLSLHLTRKHPEWILETKDKTSLWINPGIPEAREYLTELIFEIVQNYDVDGIQLDFIRYPQTQFNDNIAFKKYGNGKSLEDWRRENITQFISELKNRIKGINPQIKLGVTPIGIFKSIRDARGMESYSAVFQNTREWLKQGLIDYAAPQIYWDTKSNPKFDALVKNWVNNSYGKNIVIGIAAYKPEVYKELEREINTARNLHASGVAFFRYKNIENKYFRSFENKTLPAKMPWIKEKKGQTRLNLIATYSNHKINLLLKSDKQQLTEDGYFAIYEQNSYLDTANAKLLKVIPNYIDKINFRIPHANKICHYYYATELDKLWNETSFKSNIAKVVIPELAEICNTIKPIANPLIFQEDNTSKLILFSNCKDKIEIANKENNHLLFFDILPGYNYIESAKNLSQEEGLTLKFLNSKRMVKLRTNHLK
jgi:uncharacterized lipoprotein YddW (UPF0748 family)